jgi:UDP-glucose 4-epimerase
MPKKIVVTGYKGFVGSALVSALNQSGNFDICGVARSDGQDLGDRQVVNALPKCDKIVHLCGSVGVIKSWDNPHETYQNNLLPTLNILEFARTHQIPFIYVSSYMYGTPEYLPIDEAHPLDCKNPYAHSKRLAEMLCEAYAKDFNLPVTILRPFNIYGIGQTQDSLISYVVNQAKTQDFIQVNDLNPKRDYLHIDDLVRAILKVINADQNTLEIYNLGFGKSYSVQEIIDIILQVIPKQLFVKSLDKIRINEIMDCYSNSQKFSQKFNWSPNVSLKEGIINLLNS